MLTIKWVWKFILCWSLSTHCFASLMTFTDPGQFNNAMATAGAAVNTINFDSAPSNTSIVDGSNFAGIDFGFTDANGDSIDGMIASDFDTVSADNYLGYGALGSSAFLSGDGLSMSFSQTFQALGLYIIASPGDFGFADDAVLSAGGVSASNGNSPTQILGDGGEAFFIGLIDTDGFDFAALSTLCCGFFEFTIDNIILASFPASAPPQSVAAPAPWALMLLALPAIGWHSRRLIRPT